MVASGTVTGFTLHTRCGKSAGHARKIILALSAIVLKERPPGGVAGAAVIRLGARVFVRMIPNPFLRQQVVLDRVAGDDKAFLIDETRFPVISANHVADIVPGIAFRWVGDFSKWILRRLTIDNFA